jgi:hypothetical protein
MKTIILLLISLFLFSINLNTKQTTIKKQNDTSITVAGDFDHSVVNIKDVKMTLEDNNYFYTIVNSYDSSSSSVKTSYHFLNNINDMVYYITSNRLTVTNNVDKVQIVRLAKTFGLQHYSSQYFNIYLYHSTGKLGRT